jgi:hypothetical protein
LFRKWFPGVSDRNQPVEWLSRQSVSCDPVKLEKQAAGCLARALALRYGAQPTKEKTLELLGMRVEFVEKSTVQKVIAACPNDELRLILACVDGK